MRASEDLASFPRHSDHVGVGVDVNGGGPPYDRDRDAAASTSRTASVAEVVKEEGHADGNEGGKERGGPGGSRGMSRHRLIPNIDSVLPQENISLTLACRRKN